VWFKSFVIVGKAFRCVLKNVKPAGTGLVAYDAVCKYSDKSSGSGSLVVDIGNYYHHIEVSLPGKKEEWRPLYPCGYMHINKNGLHDHD
jgi:hypothetical protein